MIVRDEAACLGECLQSLSPIVDRIVVCDTGSTDDTASIAHSAGAEVIHRKWNHDFASARNEVLDTIADAVFILSIDADERVLCDDPDEFRRSLEALPATVDGLAIGVDNVRGDLPVSRSRAVRIFRPDRTRFRGALHETVKRLDGSDPTLLEVPDFRLLHLGYDPALPAFAEKRLRNVAIARRQHSAATNPKTALDLARSLAAADQSPDEILSVVQSATEAMEAGDPYWVALLSLRAEFELTLDHLGAALATATQILAIAPSADVAGAVLAHAANRLGRDSDIVAAARAFDHESSVGTVVPHNRATLDAFAAAATIRSGETDAAIEFALRAAANLPTRRDAVRLLASTFDDIEATAAAVVLEAVGGEETPQLLAEVLGELEPADVPATNPASKTNEPETPTTGITLALDDFAPPVPYTDIADVLPPRRRVLDVSGDESFADLLRSHDHRLTTADTPDDILSAGERDIDLVVLPAVRLEDGNVIDAVRWRLDPSGAVVAWATSPIGAQTEFPLRELANAGFMTQLLMETVVLARPEWDASMFAETAGIEAHQTLYVVADDALPEELAMALRASVPNDVELVHVEGGLDAAPGAGAGDDDLILHLSSDLIPEPGWIQAIWDAARIDGTPAGARVIDGEGRLIHAGAHEGCPVAGGESGPLPHCSHRIVSTQNCLPHLLHRSAPGAVPRRSAVES